MKPVTLSIDGQKIEAEAGQTILEAAQSAGIDIPTLCHHPALKPVGSCRVCLVEISRFQPLYPACRYEVVEGLEVQTRSPRVEKARRFVLDLLFSERNHYCMYCEMSGNCELQDLGYEYGLDHWVYPTYTERFEVDASRDTFVMDHNRCVLCRRCVRACGELVANHTLGMRQRGAKTMITADLNVPFGDSSCISCGTCLQVCPTGALIDKRSAFMGVGHNVELERVQSVCSQCSVGCGMEIVVRGGNVLRVDGDWEAVPNGGLLCEKGRFAPLYDQRQRITAPLVRRDGRLEKVTWDEALQAVAQRLKATPTENIGVLTSTQATTEALYLLRKLFREELGVANACLLNIAAAAQLEPRGTLADLAHADLILVVEADPVREQPVASFLIKRAVDEGAKLILVDGVTNHTVPFCHQHYGMAELEQAIAVASRADSPVVLYGADMSRTEVARLASLKRARFITLQPGVNTLAAAALGLECGFHPSELETLFMVLGEQPWESDELATVGAFVIVQASYESPLTEQADVVLPMAIWSERAGTLTNLEGRVQRARQAVQPQGEARADWEILSMLVETMGKGPVPSLDELSELANRRLS